MPRRTGGAGDGTATADGALLSIGAVLSRLRDEFPEVTISKIRFLEAEGLVEPQRTPSGYRKFALGDVERLAYVLRVQREHLDALDRGERVSLPGPAEPRDALEGPEPAGPPEELRIGRAELLAATGADSAELEQWESYGLVEAG